MGSCIVVDKENFLRHDIFSSSFKIFYSTVYHRKRRLVEVICGEVNYLWMKRAELPRAEINELPIVIRNRTNIGEMRVKCFALLYINNFSEKKL